MVQHLMFAIDITTKDMVQQLMFAIDITTKDMVEHLMFAIDITILGRSRNKQGIRYHVTSGVHGHLVLLFWKRHLLVLVSLLVPLQAYSPHPHHIYQIPHPPICYHG